MGGVVVVGMEGWMDGWMIGEMEDGRTKRVKGRSEGGSVDLMCCVGWI